MYKPVEYSERACLWCEKVFKPNRKDKQFCSKQCYKYHGKKTKGHSKGNWKTLSMKDRPYVRYKELQCSRCGFIPEHPCQLDVDHIDGDHNNNTRSNLQTLCANCHRMKTAIQLGWHK